MIKYKCFFCEENYLPCLEMRHKETLELVSDEFKAENFETLKDKCFLVCLNCFKKEKRRDNYNLLSKEIIYRSDMTFVEKGWGYERWIWNEAYCGKLLVFNAGKKCSFHRHAVKDEVLYISSGLILMKYSMDEDLNKADNAVLKPGQAFHVVPGMNHQMIALEDSVIFEMSTHHDEEDSYRVVKGD